MAHMARQATPWRNQIPAELWGPMPSWRKTRPGRLGYRHGMPWHDVAGAGYVLFFVAYWVILLQPKLDLNIYLN